MRLLVSACGASSIGVKLGVEVRVFALLILSGVDYIADALTFCIYNFEGENALAQVSSLVIGPSELHRVEVPDPFRERSDGSRPLLGSDNAVWVDVDCHMSVMDGDVGDGLGENNTCLCSALNPVSNDCFRGREIFHSFTFPFLH